MRSFFFFFHPFVMLYFFLSLFVLFLFPCVPVQWHRGGLHESTCEMIHNSRWYGIPTTPVIVITLGYSLSCVFSKTFTCRAVGASNECWWYRSGRGALQLSYFLNTDFSCVHCFKEVRYEKRLASIVANICNVDEAEGSFFFSDVVAILHANDRFYDIANWAYWAPYLNWEIWIGSNDWVIFYSWQNIEEFVLKIQQRCDFPSVACCHNASMWTLSVIVRSFAFYLGVLLVNCAV